MSDTQTIDEMIIEDQRNVAVEALRSIQARLDKVCKSLGLGENSPADGSTPESFAIAKAHIGVMMFQAHNALRNIEKMESAR
jgi:hypothetical protein